MKGSKHAKLGNKKGRLAYRTPFRIKVSLPRCSHASRLTAQAGRFCKNG